jgi:hypothetical protein
VRLHAEQLFEDGLHDRHMKALGVSDDPTRSRSRPETHLHFERHDEEEETLWGAWCAYLLD